MPSVTLLNHRLRRLEEREKIRRRKSGSRGGDVDPVSRILREMGPDKVDEMIRDICRCGLKAPLATRNEP